LNSHSSGSGVYSKDLNEIKRIKTIEYPIVSNFYSACREKKSEKKCREISYLKDRSYSTTEFLKEFPISGKFLEDIKVKNLNADNLRFIIKNNDIFYSIAEKYVDTDEQAISEFYLIKMKPEIKVEKIGDYYSIDSSGFISYKDKNGKLLIRNLQ
jgi:hypothetical protein